MPKPILFTQYYRPHGRTAPVMIDMDNEVADLADEIRGRGYVFECEVLQTGEVSFTVTHPRKGDVDIEVVPNGPEVPVAIERMVRRFAASLKVA